VNQPNKLTREEKEQKKSKKENAPKKAALSSAEALSPLGRTLLNDRHPEGYSLYLDIYAILKLYIYTPYICGINRFRRSPKRSDLIVLRSSLPNCLFDIGIRITTIVLRGQHLSPSDYAQYILNVPFHIQYQVGRRRHRRLGFCCTDPTAGLRHWQPYGYRPSFSLAG
jgi:hypothetical protein